MQSNLGSQLYDADPEGKLHFVIRYLRGVCDGELNPELYLFRDETWFHLSRYVNSQNVLVLVCIKFFFISDSKVLDSKVLDTQVIVWCFGSAAGFIGHFSEIVFVLWYLYAF